MSAGSADSPDGPADVHAAPPLRVPLRAGPLRVVFDRGELRWIRLGEREVLRGIYPAVREAGWATVPAALEDLEIHAEPESFRVSFVARHRRGDVALDWDARIEGFADGRISYSIDGVAGSAFLRNRIGFCVLHPIAECAGEACVIETTGGRREKAAFPRLVSPHQPFLDLRAIAHEVAPGVEVEVRMEGDTFETEDQRNWSDDSFKTYCTPLALPFPVQVRPGDRVRQSVALRLFGLTSQPVQKAAAAVPGALRQVRDSAEPVVVGREPGAPVPLPAIGLAGGGLVALTDSEAEALRGLRLDHLRADLALHEERWQPALERAAANARALGVPLELALFLPESPASALDAVAARALALGVPLAGLLLFRATPGALTAAGDVALARRAFPGVRVGGGTDRHFAELNRNRAAATGLDRVSFALTPQVHAFDDTTLVENLESLRWTAETLRAFAGGAPIALSPVSLRPRTDPRPAASRAAGERPFTDDPRQSTEFAAGWTLGLVAAAALAGFASVTLFELTGPRGVVDEGRLLPPGMALAELRATPVPQLARWRSRRPERVHAFALGGGATTRLLLVNMTEDPHPVRLEGVKGELLRSALGAATPDEPCGAELVLEPHEVVRFEFQD